MHRTVHKLVHHRAEKNDDDDDSDGNDDGVMVMMMIVMVMMTMWNRMDEDENKIHIVLMDFLLHVGV